MTLFAFLRDISERQPALIRRTRLATYTAEVGLALTAENDPRVMLQKCAELTVQYLDAAFCRIWTWKVEDSVLELQASAGLYTHTDGPHARIPIGQLKIGLIASERRPHLTNSAISVSATRRGPHEKEWFPSPATHYSSRTS